MMIDTRMICPGCSADLSDATADHGDVEVTLSRTLAGPRAQARHRVCPERPNPWRGVIGWCHSCGTVQMGDEARWLPMRWNHGAPDWSCVNCDDEPWDIGVWTNQLGYEEHFTAAAEAWLAADDGTRWAALPECRFCGQRHFDPANCANPPPPGWVEPEPSKPKSRRR